MAPVRGFHPSPTIDILHYIRHRLSIRNSFDSGGCLRCLKITYDQFEFSVGLYLSKIKRV